MKSAGASGLCLSFSLTCGNILSPAAKAAATTQQRVVHCTGGILLYKWRKFCSALFSQMLTPWAAKEPIGILIESYHSYEHVFCNLHEYKGSSRWIFVYVGSASCTHGSCWIHDFLACLGNLSATKVDGGE